ncbi:MAG: SWIM zinc finger family protein [Archaeoglobaceae archaeon]|nr:SWIM zinc finger family protein [Archaeoglobaceae archaeon]MCX8152170.1 SWIM zinc finger family protein [Archaeoglobaceae archaeon]MDW8013886.1 SWIM zinc finger family protein [Archaeoglobaceae archaeon]
MNEVIEVAKKGLSYELYKKLLTVYGRRGEKAFFYLKERRIKKYKDFFVVVGREEYVVDEFFCTCADFLIRLKGEKPCAHIIAVEVAKVAKMYDEIDAYYVDFM